MYRKGGDSLQGRYHHFRLHPFTLGEVSYPGTTKLPVPGAELSVPAGDQPEVLNGLLEYGGFPEPYLAQSDRVLRRWQKERLDRFFREDIRDLEPIRDLGSLQLLADLLPERVGSLLRDRDGREVDFLVTHRNKPWFAVEVKTSGTDVEPALAYFRDRLAIPWVYQVTLDGTRDFIEDGVRLLPASRFIGALV